MNFRNLRKEVDSLKQHFRASNNHLPDIQWIPHVPHPRQQLFLDIEAEEAFYGGAAGGGKSDALLMASLQYVNEPGYAALLLRRTYADLTLPEALMARAREWLQPFVPSVKWIEKEKTWLFPSGATLTFGYLENENDKYRYQGSAYQYIGFDELTQFTETQYLYLFSRLRKLTASDVPLRMRSASNPGGIGAIWVRERFVPDDFTPQQAVTPQIFEKQGTDADGNPTIRYFVPARVSDNPSLDEASYRSSLNRLDAVTREQLLKGDWSISERGNIFPDWDEQYHVISWSEFQRVFGVAHIPHHWLLGIGQDWGSTETHPCVSTWVARAAENSPLPGTVFVYRGLTVFGKTPREVATLIKQTMAEHREQERCHQWYMSHEAKSERDTYNREHQLPFWAWKPDKNGGIAQVRDFLEINKEKPHPFRNMMGCPSLFLVVSDEELLSPRTDAGLARHRAEFAAYRYDTPKSGEPARTLAPYPLFNDAMDSLRGLAAAWFPAIKQLSAKERARVRYEKKMEEIAQLPDPASRTYAEMGYHLRQAFYKQHPETTGETHSTLYGWGAEEEADEEHFGRGSAEEFNGRGY